MKRLVLLMLCAGMIACGYGYYQGTFALPQTQIEDGIRQSFQNTQTALMPGGTYPQSLTVTNNRQDAECLFRTYLAFENTGGVFDDQITVGWNTDDYEIERLEGEAQHDGGTFRVFVATCRQALGAGKTSTSPIQSLSVKSTADRKDVQAVGETYSVYAFSEAVWREAADASAEITLELLGDPSISRMQF